MSSLLRKDLLILARSRLLVALLIRLTPKPPPLPTRREPETPKAGDEPRPSHAM